jgi:hypothetical protein
MIGTRSAIGLGLATLALGAGRLEAQGYSLRLDLQAQSFAFRGLSADSIRQDSVVTGPGGGFVTPDGNAAVCPGNTVSYCDFFRAGPSIRAIPIVGEIEGNLWGFGVRGLRLHAAGRVAGQAGDPNALATTTPAVQLLEGYAEYSHDWLRGRLGRQIVTGRLGYTGFDGALVDVRDADRGLGVTGYLGWGLAQATSLPPTNPILNPLDQFQPAKGKTVAGTSVNWSSPRADARFDYQREVDNDTRNFVSERLALNATGRLSSQWGVTGGAIYDLSFAWWGTADLTVRYTGSRVTGSAGVRRYRPFFDLWSLWGAFSPIPYSAANGALSVQVGPRLELRGAVEYFWYGDDHAETPLVTVVDNGWRSTLAAGYRISPTWNADANFEIDRGPGAASNYLQGQVRWAARPGLDLAAHLGTLSRPLEFRYNSAGLFWIGLQGDYQATSRTTLSLLADWMHDSQQEPDVGDFSWSQLRLSLRATWFLNSRADLVPLPKALPRRPPPQ